MNRTRGVGLDGCRGGWVAAVLDGTGDGHGDGRPTLHLLDAIGGVLDLLPERRGRRATALVDIPIGLPLAGERPVDGAARGLLGRRRSSVFTIPPRPVLDALDFAEAQGLARAAMGKGFSIQAWNILPKIREVDLFLRRRGTTERCLRESHPELVFRGLALDAGLDPDALAAKRAADGAAARRRVLAAHGIDVDALPAGSLREGGVVAKGDDVLDALALAVLARAGRRGQAILPAAPETDAVGLPMEMVVPAALLRD